ncbi:MAG: 50S ribosomal protein L24 [Spirochaetes bacterium]|nr:50S ribosomal protein L24 [Spirochaetota bacterium]
MRLMMKSENAEDCVKTKFKKNDSVVVISGSDRGKRGKILKVDRTKGRVIVEGVNKRNKYLKPSQDNPKGRLVNIEYPIHISNIMYFCDKCKKGTRIGINQTEKAKVRVCRSCSKSIDK